jgi:hypothetical protein
VRLDPKIREEQLLAAALECCPPVGLYACYPRSRGTTAPMFPGFDFGSLGTMREFRRKLMRYAVRVQCLPVIAQGLAARDPHAQKAAPELKQKALAAL